MDKVILGPAPCKVCGVPLTWNGWVWQEDGQRHICHRPMIDEALREADRVIAASGRKESEE